MAKSRLIQDDIVEFAPGQILAKKYEVLSRLGSGWEGVVYLVCERDTGVERAIKVFYPKRNPNDRAVKFYARKLHRLRDCPILIQYHTQEHVVRRRVQLTLLVSEYVEGELLSDFLARQPGRRLAPFEALHLLYALASGVENIHLAREYHGDLHEENIIVRRRGISFAVKVVDMFYWGPAHAENIRDDVCNMIRIFYDALGGARFYSRQAPEIKGICCGLKRTLIVRKFRTAGHLRRYLETMSWQE